MNIGNAPGKKSLGFSINIVPIVDALTILITFMLAAGVYISIAVLDVKVSGASSSAAPSESKDPITVTVRMLADAGLAIEVSGSVTRTEQLAALGGKYNLPQLRSHLKELRDSFPKVRTATLVASQASTYQDVVSVMEATQGTHKEVVLGGY